MNFVYPNYSAEEHETWGLLFNKQKELLPERACKEFLEGLDKLNFSDKKIPALSDVSATLNKCTQWKIARVEGLVPEKEFFELLSQRLFPSTDFIRKREDLNYTPAPDMFHDLFGHISMITNPDFADFFQAMGKAGVNANPEQLKEVQRFYWFTVEFGLIYNSGKKRIYGSGILSSPGEVVYCLSDKVNVQEFNTEVVVHKDFDIWHMQDDLFIINNFSQLKEEFIKYGKNNKLLH